eukprot:gene17226-5339_t
MRGVGSKEQESKKEKLFKYIPVSRASEFITFTDKPLANANANT